MAKIRKIFHCLILLCLFLGSGAEPLSAMTRGLDSNPDPLLHPDASVLDRETNQEIPDSFELVGENDNFKLYADRITLAFKVEDKRSDYIWHSNLDEKGEDDKLNRTWTAFATSGFSIDYLDLKAQSVRLSITRDENTIDFKKVEGGFEVVVTFPEPSISIGLVVKLEPEGVSVDIPFETIKEENPEFKLGLIYLYPFMGATRDDSVPGYMFIPDGSGTLVKFGASTKAKNMFYGRYYGEDLGMLTALSFDPTVNRPFNLSIPVYGMVHGEGENAFIGILEKGAAYGELQAHPAGIITNFNFIHNTFVYNQSYFQATNRSGAGVTTLQKTTNAFDVKLHYRFLSGEESNYVGMARSYQQYLLDRGDLKKSLGGGEDISIRLEFLGAEKTKVLFWNNSIPMTTIEQMAAILDDLNVQNPEVVYYGWQPKGASTMPPESLKLDKSLGSLGQLKSLMEKVTVDGGKFYLYYDPQSAFVNEKGYNSRHDLAMSITNNNLIGYNRNKVNFYLNMDALSKSYTALSNDIYNEINGGVALDGIPRMVYSDFKPGNILNREDAITKYKELLGETAGSKAFYTPNDYMFKFMDAYFDIPISDSGYIYTHETIPFLQIVFGGYVPFYGTALNFSSDVKADLLRHADFGVYPSYFLTEEVTAKILKTDSSWIYSSSYGQWGEEVNSTYQWLNNLLGPVKGETIVARENLAKGVVATTYSNGNMIIVNYNAGPFVGRGVTIAGRDAVLKEVNP